VELFIEEVVTVVAADNGDSREVCCFCAKICCSGR